MSTGSNIGSFSLGTDYKLSDNQTLSVQAWIETKGSKQSDFFSVSNRDEKYESNSLDDFNTDDYTIGLFYKGTVLKHLIYLRNSYIIGMIFMKIDFIVQKMM